MSPTWTLTSVTGQTTVTLEVLEPAPDVDEDDEEEVDDELALEAEAADEEAALDDVPLVAAGSAPKARSYFVAATRLPLAAAVCWTVVVVACEVR